ncbi:MAG: hypothetical protein FD160_4051, partial [Caulobacteraceae bacterium]
VWLDEGRDLVYVANTFGRSILVWEDAATVDGDTPPARVIEHDRIGSPVFVFVEPARDLLFVAVMAMDRRVAEPSIAVYARASTRSGYVEPDVVIAGPSTRIDAGNNQTTHNVWYDDARHLLIVGHHTNEVRAYDGASTISGIVAPARVIQWTTGMQYFPPQPLWVTVP